jgi:hypothetical protein
MNSLALLELTHARRLAALAGFASLWEAAALRLERHLAGRVLPLTTLDWAPSTSDQTWLDLLATGLAAVSPK